MIILTTPRVHSVADNPNNTPNNSEGLQVVSLIILIILLIIPGHLHNPFSQKRPNRVEAIRRY